MGDPNYKDLLERFLAPRPTESPSAQRLHSSSDDLEWPALTEELAGFCQSEVGAVLGRRLPILGDRNLVVRRLREVEEARELVDRGHSPGLAGVVDVTPHLARSEREGILEGEALLAIATLAEASDQAAKSLSKGGEQAPLLAEVGADLQPVGWLASIIRDAIDPVGVIKDSASPALGKLRERVRLTDQNLSRRVERSLHSPEFEPHLQDRFFTIRDGRYVLPVKAGQQADVPGILHGKSGSGQTFFIEPTEIVDANNRLKVAEIAVEEEELAVLSDLSIEVAAVAADLKSNLDRLAYLDVTFSAGRLAMQMNAVRPNLSDDATVDLVQARHPLLALREWRSEGGFRVVANDIRFGYRGSNLPDGDDTLRAGPVLVISGPNTGGKTVTLKTLGLFAMMLRVGLLIPCRGESSFPLFDSVLADIGDEQSLSENLSSFSAHLINLKRFLPIIDERSLVLLDELFSGTDPVQGAALSAALMELVAERGALIAVTTHSQPLKRFALSHERFVNASMGFDPDTLKPTYELDVGFPGSSHAVDIARRLGLPDAIVDRAQTLLEGEREPEVEALLRDLELQRRRLLEQQRELQLAKVEAEEEAQQYARDRKRLEQSALEDIDERLSSAFKDIREVELRIKRHRKALQQNTGSGPTERKMAEMAKDLRNLRADLKQNQTERERKEIAGRRSVVAKDSLRPGDDVWVGTLKRIGQVIEVDKRDQVWVQVGGLKTTVSAADLFEPNADESQKLRAKRSKQPRAQKPRSTAPRRRQPSSEAGLQAGVNEPDPPQHPGNTADLRGKRADEGIDELERFLDACLTTEEQIVYAIHGHGTGALKTAVRAYLATSPYVASFRPAKKRQGGDGVTLIELR